MVPLWRFKLSLIYSFSFEESKKIQFTVSYLQRYEKGPKIICLGQSSTGGDSSTFLSHHTTTSHHSRAVGKFNTRR